MEKWLQELIDLGIGRIAIKNLALLDIPFERWNHCPSCGNPIKKWAKACPKCRVPLP